MSADATFEKVTGSGWSLGFAPLFKKELGEWLEPRRWLGQTVLWMVILNGFLSLVLFVLPNLVTPEGGAAIENPLMDGLIGFFGLGGIALSIGVIILTQNEIIGEKQSGTAEWVLSKPASRSAFFVSKLLANTLGMLVIMVVVQGAIAYVQAAVLFGGPVSTVDFVVGMSMLALHVFFYLSLTLMMGVFSENREAVLGVSLGFLLFGSLARNFVGQLALATPWLLADFAGVVAAGQGLSAEMLIPIVSTAVLSLAFIVAALWRFQRYEF